MATSSTSSVTAPVVSIASSSSSAAAGGSVINVSTLVSELVAATRAPQDSEIASQTSTVTTNISAVGTLKSALSTFQSSLSSLSSPSAFATVTASSSNQTVFTASADSSAVNGSYNVTISQLAQAQQLLSKPFSGGSSAAVGTGTLSLTLGGTSFNLTIDSTDDTVAGVAAAINSASGNPGISASVVTGTDGAHLVLASSLTGASNTIQVTETDGGTGLSALTYGTGNTTHYTQNSPAQDASFSVAGVPYTSASNTVSNAISGVTLNLLAQSSSGASLTVANDTTTVASNISSFVSAYNTLQTALSSLGSYDSTTGTAGPMLGDSLLTGIQSQLRKMLSSQVNTGSSTYNSLVSVGITTKSDGTLTLDSTKLSTALSSNFSAVSKLFSSTTGVAASLNTQITADLATGGTIDSRSKSLIEQNTALTDESNKLNDQMTALTASLTQQYSALNTLLSSLQTTSAYLSQAFASLPQVQSKSNA